MNGDHEHIPQCDECDPQPVAPFGFIESFCAACGAPRWPIETPDVWATLTDTLEAWGRRIHFDAVAMWGEQVGRRTAINVANTMVDILAQGHPMPDWDLAVYRGGGTIVAWHGLPYRKDGWLRVNADTWTQAVDSATRAAHKRRRKAQQ